MPVRSAAFGTVTIVACCLLPPAGQPARANTEPSHITRHHQPAATTAAALELPAFQPGLWLYRRTVVKADSPAPQVSMLKICADPSAEMRTKMAQLESRSCRFAPLAHRHGRYFSSWICTTPEGPARFRSVLIVKGANRYTHLSEMRSAQSATRQRIEAVRVGECPALGSPMSPNARPMPHT